jgi:hypothetical protein
MMSNETVDALAVQDRFVDGVGCEAIEVVWAQKSGGRRASFELSRDILLVF